jgi:hypothetical protein
MTKRKTEKTDTYFCEDGEHAVVTVVPKREGEGDGKMVHRREPCEQCPWRSDLPTGVFPPDAFKRSASTSYDQAMSKFACHMSGSEKPATCAGFLLRGADNNIGVRMAAMTGSYDPRTVTDGGKPLYDSYRDMAEANGVDPKDSALDKCR